MVPIEIKERAMSLRKQGMTYKQISSSLDGAVSIDWCKKNLKNIKKSQSNDLCIQEIIKLGCRPQGTTEYEATAVVFKYYENASTDKIRYLKNKAKEIEPKCLIHTGWIDHMNPSKSHDSLNTIVLHLMDHLDLLVEDYLELYPNCNKWSVRHEMLKLAFSDKISGEPLASRLYKNELLAEMLQERR